MSKVAIAVIAATMILSDVCHGQICPNSSELPLETNLMCPNIPPKGWPAGASVTVYIVNTTQNPFSGAQITAIGTEIANWNSRLQMLGGNPPIFGTPQIVPVRPNNPRVPYALFQFGPLTGCTDSSQACTTTIWSCASGLVDHSITNVQIGFTNPGYQLWAHEIEHTFGVYDCNGPDCSSAVSLMNLPTGPNTAMAPHCCDTKALWRESGSYGQSGQCNPIVVQGTTASPGTAFLTPYPGSQTSASATFPANPQSGDTIIAGCLEIHYDGVTPVVSDNQGNGMYQFIVGGYDLFDNSVPVVLYVATQNLSSQSGEFTLTCSGDHPDTIDLFALEFADLGDSSHILDTANIHQGTLDNPYNCGTLNTGAANDLIMSIYNNASPDNPVGISPTLGTVPPCNGGQGNQCVAQDGQAYEAGGISTYTAMSAGQYTPAWNWGSLSAMSCAGMALKVIGP